LHFFGIDDTETWSNLAARSIAVARSCRSCESAIN